VAGCRTGRAPTNVLSLIIPTRHDPMKPETLCASPRERTGGRGDVNVRGGKVPPMPIQALSNQCNVQGKPPAHAEIRSSAHFVDMHGVAHSWN
jgi:hypothetical protein